MKSLRESNHRESRRAVLGRCGQFGAALGLTCLTNLPQVHAAENNALRVGLIGAGGRGCGAARNALEANQNAKIVAIGDVFETKAEAARKTLSQSDPQRADVPDEKCFSGFDSYAKVIDAGVDVVLLATPPGFRPRQFEAAIRAGKHVFMEKPVAVDAPGARRVLAASGLSDDKGLKVVVGYQRRHDPRYVESVKVLRGLGAGAIQKLEACWRQGGIWARARQPGMTEMEYQISNWIHFVWLSGDCVVELHTHNLDTCNWAMGTHPDKVSGKGGQLKGGPDRGDAFDNFTLEYVYPDGTPMTSECGYIFNQNGRVGEWATTNRGPVPIAMAARGAANKNPYIAEWEDLFNAITQNKQMNDAPAAAEAALTGIMGRMAAYTGKEIRWRDVIASGESFEPAQLNKDAMPPAEPDAAGQYHIPAVGRNRNLAMSDQLKGASQFLHA